MKHIQNNFVIVTLLIALLIVVQLFRVEQQIKRIQDSTYSKSELQLELEIMGLESEKRMIESTDRTMYDLNRLDSINECIKCLKQKRVR